MKQASSPDSSVCVCVWGGGDGDGDVWGGGGRSCSVSALTAGQTEVRETKKSHIFKHQVLHQSDLLVLS